MRRLPLLSLLLAGSAVSAQPVFTNASGTLGHSASSGGCVAVADMDGDGLDDIIQFDDSRDAYVLYQNADHSFTMYDYGTMAGQGQWGWAIADIDNNGHKDIVSGGSYDGTHYLRITSRGVATLTDLDGPDIFTQAMSIGDMNNDGLLDVYACHDDGPPNVWFTNGSGVPVNNNAYFNWLTTCAGTSEGQPGDMSGNYGSTFTDFDRDGDIDLHISHCRQGVNDPEDCRRWDRMFVNDGNNQYADLAASHGLQNKEQVWTSDFGDYDNDGDLDVFSTTHSTSLMLFENDGNNNFTNVTATSGLADYEAGFLQGLFRDLDNDGYLDILTSGGLAGTAHHYFKGNGDGTFTHMNNVFPASKQMHSFAFGDLNGDGFEDVYASYGDGYINNDAAFPDRLWLNTPNGNHFLRVNLTGVESNLDGVGAMVTIEGPWGTMIREVHAGESYGITNSSIVHFGLGANAVIPTLTIRWPSGQVDTYTDLSADQTISVVEGTCISPNVSIQLSGAPIVCTGGSPLTLDATAGAGFSYLWNTTDETATITVTTGGTYQVTVDDGTGCTGQASVFISQDPDETPTVTAGGPTTFCASQGVTLSSSAASGYTWNNGAGTAQTATVYSSGSYTVTVQGVCAQFTSEAIEITSLAEPGAPTASDVTINTPGTAELNATGTNVVWYDAASGGTLVGEGSPWTTPFLNASTSFWAADQNLYGGVAASGGRVDNSTVGAYHNNTAYWLLFDVYEPLIINSVKVYANGTAARTIAVVDGQGNTVAQGTFTIPNGTSVVALDFEVPAGVGYGLRMVNEDHQLWRDDQGSNPTFPYTLGTLGSITGTNVGGAGALSRYYYFYDWQVQSPVTACTGPRTEVHVSVGPEGLEEMDASGFRAYPVPTNGLLNLDFGTITGTAVLHVVDATGRTVFTERRAAGVNTPIDLGSLAKGGYTLRVEHAAGVTVRRVTVQ